VYHFFNVTLWFDPNTTLRSSLSVYLRISEYLTISLKRIGCKSKCILAGIVRRIWAAFPSFIYPFVNSIASLLYSVFLFQLFICPTYRHSSLSICQNYAADTKATCRTVTVTASSEAAVYAYCKATNLSSVPDIWQQSNTSNGSLCAKFLHIGILWCKIILPLVLYGCETRSRTWKKNNRGVSEENAVENICVCVQGGIKGILEEIASHSNFLLFSELY
jgi:hypothetical protein